MLRRVAPILAKNRWKRLAAPHRLVVVAVVMVVTVVFIMAVVMAVIMVVMMVMTVFVLMMVQPLARPRPARILVEHQRFDGDRHGIGRHADAAEIDIVEIPQHHAIDDQTLALPMKL